MPKVAFLLLPPFGRFCSKIKIGSIVQSLIFSLPFVCWLELSFVDEWNNRYKSMKIFLYISTKGLENKGQGRRKNLIWSICPRGVSGLLSLYSPLSHPPAALASWLTLNTPGPALPGPGPMHSFLFLSHSPRCMVHTSPLSLCTHAAFSVGGCLSPPPPPPA